MEGVLQIVQINHKTKIYSHKQNVDITAIYQKYEAKYLENNWYFRVFGDVYQFALFK